MKELDSKDEALLQALQENPFISDTELAKIYKINRVTIKKRKENPLFIEELANRNKTVYDKFLDLRGEAVTALRELLKTENETVRLGAIKEVIKGMNPDNVNFKGKLSIEEEAKELLRMLNEKS